MSAALRVDKKTISTRAAAKEILEEAQEEGHDTVDLSKVESISQSVADEFLTSAQTAGLKLSGLQGEVKKVILAVAGKSSEQASA
jgi:anti-anti-sigma regulatory factor